MPLILHCPLPFLRRLRGGFRTFAIALWIALLSLSWACLSPLKRADELFADGVYSEAAAAYEAALIAGADPHEDRVRFHLALIYALPESPIRQPERARQLLGELAVQDPPGPYQRTAAGLLELDELRAAVAALEKSTARSKGTGQELRARLKTARDELKLCERKLDELKRIDLGGRD